MKDSVHSRRDVTKSRLERGRLTELCVLTNLVGGDVSAKTFTLIIDHDGAKTDVPDLPNDSNDQKKLIRMITRKGFHARVVLGAKGFPEFVSSSSISWAA